MTNEHKTALRLIEKVLDRPYADPDDDIAVLARQLQRTREALILILPMAKGYAYEHDVGNNKKMINDVVETYLGDL